MVEHEKGTSSNQSSITSDSCKILKTNQARKTIFYVLDNMIKTNILFQMVAVIISIIYYGQQINQDGVMNINGALFLFVTNMTFQNALAVINVSCKI